MDISHFKEIFLKNTLWVFVFSFYLAFKMSNHKILSISVKEVSLDLRRICSRNEEEKAMIIKKSHCKHHWGSSFQKDLLA